MFYFATVAPEGRKQWPDVALAHLPECDSNIYVHTWSSTMHPVKKVICRK